MKSCKTFQTRGVRPARCSGAPRRPVVRTRAIAEPPEYEAVNHQEKVFKADLEALKLDEDTAKDLYRDMRLGRDFEDMCAQMYYRGKMFGFVHLYCGQEAVSTGVIRLLGKKDYVCSTYRDHVHALSKGSDPKAVMAELFGKQTGLCRGQGGSMHMFDASVGLLGGYAFIGEGIPVGLGAAFQSKYRVDVLHEDGPYGVTCSFFGDGTCNVGQFYECLNMASLYKLPHIFVVENNKWAIGMSHARSTAESAGDEYPYIYKKGPPFGMPSVYVDGMDVVKVREVAIEAIERARRGEGPTLIEAETYRFRGHSLADPDELRSKDEKQAYQDRDPLPAFREFCKEHSLLSADDFKQIDDEITKLVDEAVEFADESPKPEKGQLLENVFADPKGFGIDADGEYRYTKPGFTSGMVDVS